MSIPMAQIVLQPPPNTYFQMAAYNPHAPPSNHISFFFPRENGEAILAWFKDQARACEQLLQIMDNMKVLEALPSAGTTPPGTLQDRNPETTPTVEEKKEQ